MNDITRLFPQCCTRVLSRTLNFTRSKNGGLRKFVQSWLGKTFSDDAFNEFDTNDLVGIHAQLSVILNESGEYSNIDTVMQLPKGMPAPQATSPLIRYDMEPWDDAAFAQLPDWAQEKVKKSTQYQKLHVPTEAIDVELDGGNTEGRKPVAHRAPNIDFTRLEPQNKGQDSIREEENPI